MVTDLAVKLDAGHSWGSGSNKGWFDLLSGRWLLVDGSVPGQNSFFVLSLIPHINAHKCLQGRNRHLPGISHGNFARTF